MTKVELSKILNEKLGLPRKEAAAHLESLLEVIKSALEQGERLKISGFGVFEVKHKNARRGRNPQTGESITLAPRRILSFSPSALLKQAINK